jgi:hypothetical protein
MVTLLVGSGKEAFEMARRACCGRLRRRPREVGEIKCVTHFGRVLNAFGEELSCTVHIFLMLQGKIRLQG